MSKNGLYILLAILFWYVKDHNHCKCTSHTSHTWRISPQSNNSKHMGGCQNVYIKITHAINILCLCVCGYLSNLEVLQFVTQEMYSFQNIYTCTHCRHKHTAIVAGTNSHTGQLGSFGRQSYHYCSCSSFQSCSSLCSTFLAVAAVAVVAAEEVVVVVAAATAALCHTPVGPCSSPLAVLVYGFPG